MTDEEAFAVCKQAIVGMNAAQGLTIIANLLAFIMFQDPKGAVDDDAVWRVLRLMTEQAVKAQSRWQ